MPGGAITGILHYREKVKRQPTIGEEDITSSCHIAVLQEKMYLQLFLCSILSLSFSSQDSIVLIPLLLSILLPHLSHLSHPLLTSYNSLPPSAPPTKCT